MQSAQSVAASHAVPTRIDVEVFSSIPEMFERSVAAFRERVAYVNMGRSLTYDDLGAYRAYIVNHEVGRFLNQNVAYCPGEGKVAPVMMDQSVDLYGCTANPWPRDAD